MSHSDATLQLNVKENHHSALHYFKTFPWLIYMISISILLYITIILLLGLENLKIQFWNMNEAFRKDEEESSNLTNVVFKGCVAGRKPRTFFWVPYLHAMWLLIATSASKWERTLLQCMYEAWKKILVF